MVAGVGFEPTTSGPGPVKPGRMEECQPGFSGLRKTAVNAEEKEWLRGLDLNQRPPGYEPDELPGCSTPRKHDSGCARCGQISPTNKFCALCIRRRARKSALDSRAAVSSSPRAIRIILEGGDLVRGRMDVGDSRAALFRAHVQIF
jgi:hypothetical protein